MSELEKIEKRIEQLWEQLGYGEENAMHKLLFLTNYIPDILFKLDIVIEMLKTTSGITDDEYHKLFERLTEEFHKKWHPESSH